MFFHFHCDWSDYSVQFDLVLLSHIYDILDICKSCESINLTSHKISKSRRPPLEWPHGMFLWRDRVTVWERWLAEKTMFPSGFGCFCNLWNLFSTHQWSEGKVPHQAPLHSSPSTISSELLLRSPSIVCRACVLHHHGGSICGGPRLGALVGSTDP